MGKLPLIVAIVQLCGVRQVSLLPIFEDTRPLLVEQCPLSLAIAAVLGQGECSVNLHSSGLGQTQGHPTKVKEGMARSVPLGRLQPVLSQ